MSADPEDTIAAIASAAGPGAISIVRLSGPDSLAIADRVFRGPGAPPSARPGGTFVRGYVVDPARPAAGRLDEVVLLVYRAPRSYTREDVVEIQGHGGREAARRILGAVLNAGARPAEAGEFTRRAFLNGRIDLVQAEAVMDLIAARSDRAARAAVEQLAGSLSARMNAIYAAIVAASADLEASLDFPDEEFPVDLIEKAREAIDEQRAALRQVLDSWQEGHLLRDGALVVISGRPNVGKSTLLNRLLGSERAIVSDTPGTTRDTIEETLILDGIPIRLVDTAGLRESGCAVERAGVERARDYICRADLRLHVLDGTVIPDEEERKFINELVRERTIIVINKDDLPQAVVRESLPDCEAVTCSATTGRGLQALKDAIIRKLEGSVADWEPRAVISERHRRLAQEAMDELTSASLMMQVIGPEVLVISSELVRSAAEHVGHITGRRYYADLLDRIFSRFCIGK